MTTENTTSQPDTYSAMIKAMRDPDVTSANSATVWARETFARLLAVNPAGLHAFDIDMAIIAVCTVYKPLSPKGKRVDTIGALKNSGFPAMADRLNDVKRINGQLGVAGVQALVDAFVASTGKGAADSFAALVRNVKAAVAAAGKAAAGEGEAETEGEGEGESQPMTRLEALATLIDGASDTDLADMLALIETAIIARMPAEQEALAA